MLRMNAKASLGKMKRICVVLTRVVVDPEYVGADADLCAVDLLLPPVGHRQAQALPAVLDHKITREELGARKDPPPVNGGPASGDALAVLVSGPVQARRHLRNDRS